MKITKQEQVWVKVNRDVLLGLLNQRLSDYLNALVEESDAQKSEVMKMWIKELKSIIITINNICNLKDKRKRKKDEPDFSGI